MDLESAPEHRSPPILAWVLPCYNEQDALPISIARLLHLREELLAADAISPKSFLMLVDDGSDDESWDIVTQMAEEQPKRIRAIRLSRNFGHQAALLAGMHEASKRAEAVITLDADLQDDITIIPQMVQHYRAGAEIVYGVRSSRKTDSLRKRIPAKLYYRTLRYAGVHIIYNHGDYRLVSRKVLKTLKSYREVNLFLRGVFPSMGFRHVTVPYERATRVAGSSKYSLRKLIGLGLSGVTAFSTVPLRLVTLMGITAFLVSLGLSGYALWSYFFSDTVPGWASTVLSTYLIGGVQLISIGIIGEYLARIYQEVKDRPRYIIEARVGD